MKIKILILAVISVLIYSCAAKNKTVVQTTTPPPAITVIELSPEIVEGRNLYENNCVDCHKLFPPSRHTKEEWVPVLDRMAKKAKITEDQKKLIYNYLIAGM